MRVRENIWDRNSDAVTNQDELEQTAKATDLRKHFNFITSPEPTDHFTNGALESFKASNKVFKK